MGMGIEMPSPRQPCRDGFQSAQPRRSEADLGMFSMFGRTVTDRAENVGHQRHIFYFSSL